MTLYSPGEQQKKIEYCPREEIKNAINHWLLIVISASSFNSGINLPVILSIFYFFFLPWLVIFYSLTTSKVHGIYLSLISDFCSVWMQVINSRTPLCRLKLRYAQMIITSNRYTNISYTWIGPISFSWVFLALSSHSPCFTYKPSICWEYSKVGLNFPLGNKCTRSTKKKNRLCSPRVLLWVFSILQFLSYKSLFNLAH